MYGGPCLKCRKTHSIFNSPAAKAAAQELKQRLDKNDKDLGVDAQRMHGRDCGGMMGVLLCVDPRNGKVVELKAFSGHFDNTALVDIEGWSPPLSTETPDQGMKCEGLVIALGRKMEEQSRLPRYLSKNDLDAKRRQLQRCILSAEEIVQLETTQVELDALQEAVKAKSKGFGDWPLYKKIAEGMYPPVDDYYSNRAAVEERRERLNEEIAALNLELNNAQAELAEARRAVRMVSSFADHEPVLIRKVCCGQNFEENPQDKKGRAVSISGRLGDCAAPKLFADAKRLKLVPIGMSEFWYGTSHANGTISGAEIESCELCRATLGFQLCGLDERQESTDQSLKESSTL